MVIFLVEKIKEGDYKLAKFGVKINTSFSKSMAKRVKSLPKTLKIKKLKVPKGF